MSTNNFPLSAGTYMCQRDADLIIIVIKGLFPMLRLDSGFDLGYFLKKRKLKEVSKGILANIEIFPEMWRFTPLRDLNYSVFSKNEFHATGRLELPIDREADIKEKYYLLTQQGVSTIKIIRALTQEFKVSPDTICDLVNGFDKQAL